MAIAIISRVNEPTLILAVIVAVAHVAVIFWPRKPITEPTDKDGMPIIWHNQDESRQNITCIWHEPSPGGSTTALASKTASMTSFSETVQQLGIRTAEGKRSAA